MNGEFVQHVMETGLDPAAYAEVMEQQAAVDPADLPGDEAEHAEFARLNLHRVRRIRRTWRPSAELSSLTARIQDPQLWMALTEPWCGDSAQCLPCLEVLAAGNPLITLRYVLRDDHPEIMDRFLTDGKRSIPVVAGFGPRGGELFRWGPRPAAAQAIFDTATAQGLEKPVKLEKLHLFYGRDRGRALDAELTVLWEQFGDRRP